MGKTSTERVRAFRQRQRAHQPPKPPQGPPKSGAERMRAFRARKKQSELALITGALTTTTTISTSSRPLPSILKQPITQAKHMQILQKRKKNTPSNQNNGDTCLPISAVFIEPEDILLDFDSVEGHDEDLQAEIEIKPELKILTECISIDESTPYTDFTLHQGAHREFAKKIYDNPFGYVCDICDRLWFKNELKPIYAAYVEVLRDEFPDSDIANFMACPSCLSALNRNRVPKFSKSMGFQYPAKPDRLPELDLISERLISPCIPFTQIRKSSHVNGHYGLSGQIFNIPIDTKTSARTINTDTDPLSLHIKQEEDESNDSIGSINKTTIRTWLQYLCDSPLYKFYGIAIDDSFFENTQLDQQDQQQSLLWSEGGYLRILPGEKNNLRGTMFEEHEEELSFPSIYLGKFRKFRDNLKVSPYSIAMSELRRADRRGVKPYHLLYVAMKIIRLRVKDSLKFVLYNPETDMKEIREQLETGEYINQSLETSLAFLRGIPNSLWHWADRKEDLFAMLKQLGRPNLSLKLRANETGWLNLLKTLYEISNSNSECTDEMISKLSHTQKSILVHNDAVTCAIYFSKLINVIMSILQAKKANPFGEYRVLHYFQRVEFHDQDSPYAHLLLWLENAPEDPVCANKGDTIAMIQRLMSISPKESSGHIGLQSHEHISTCYRSDLHCHRQCGAPFMPSRKTTIVAPMPRTDPEFTRHFEHFKIIRDNLERFDYADIETFYMVNDITSDEHYLKILSAGFSHPEVLLKRQPTEKWIIPFNPFILNVFKSSVEVQVILDDYSCAVHVAEYVNRTNNGMRDLQSYLTEKLNENPDCPIVNIIKELSEDVLNAVEITNDEAAWYLLAEPITKTSTTIAYIPTLWPSERQRIKQIREESEKLGLSDDVVNVWKDNWFDKYQKRPDCLEEVTLAQFVSNYAVQGEKYMRQKFGRIIRYRNYDIDEDLYEYKREMVTLHLPFRNEAKELLDDFKFLKLYDDNEVLIDLRRQQFESGLDLLGLIKMCSQPYREEESVDPLDISVDA